MTEALILLLVGNAVAAGFLLLLHHAHAWALRLVLWSCIAAFVLVEWSLISFRVGFYTVLGHEHSPLFYAEAESPLYATDSAIVAYTLCGLAVCGLLLRLIFPALREYVLPRATRSGLLMAIFTLLPLQVALFLDAFAPVFAGPLGMGFSLIVAAAVFFLSLWAWGVARLRRHLNLGDRRFVRKTPRRVRVDLTAPAPRRPFLTPHRKRALISFGLPLLLLSPLLLIEWREPKSFPPEVQQAMDEIFLKDIREHGELFPRQEMEELYREFTLSGDARTRSDKRHWSMLHLACWFDKPALTEYLLRCGADAEASTVSFDGWAETTVIEIAVSNALYHKNEDARRNLELLLAHGVKVDGGESSSTPLLLCTHEKDAEEMFLLLLKHGAQVEDTPVHPYLYLTAQHGWVRATRCLLELNAPLEEDDEEPVLVGAARGAHCPGALECARLLLEAGCAVNWTDDDASRNILMPLIANGENRDDDAVAVELTGQMVQLFLAAGAQMQDLWEVSPRARHQLAARVYAEERRREGKTVAEVLKAERPNLAAWLRKRGVKLEND